MSAPRDVTPSALGDEVGALDEDQCELTLFVSGASELSARAIASARALCDTRMEGRYRLCVVDVHEGGGPPVLSASVVLATPTLVKNWPLPVRKFVGDLSDTDKVLVALGLPLAEDALRQNVVA
jgi:circadian clock protein KaiB